MISFSTEFAINPTASVQDVLSIAREWIYGSPFTSIKRGSLDSLHHSSEGTLVVDGEQITVGYASLPDYDIGGFRYSRLENEHIEWVTTIVCTQTPSQHLVSIQVGCEALKTASHLPHPKKPHFIKQVFANIGGGMDGEIPVSDKAIRLKSDGVLIAAALIRGEANNALPIVYVSSGFDNSYAVDPDKLAYWLSGMSHVVVEPDREFSLRLKKECSSKNVYGGTVGVYWPDSSARKSYFLNEEIESSEDLQGRIVRDVRSALSNRRLKGYCTWLHLKECISRSKYESLKNSGSADIEKYIEVFDADLSAKQQKIDEAEREIARLNAELRRLSSMASSGDGGVISFGSEQDFYRGEIKGVVIEALKKSADMFVENGRCRHVIEDIVSCNVNDSEAESIADTIKIAFKQYVDMDSKLRGILSGVGFELSEDGKHYKLIYQGDGRYTFAISKTSSDHRAGKNIASDINKKLFP